MLKLKLLPFVPSNQMLTLYRDSLDLPQECYTLINAWLKKLGPDIFGIDGDVLIERARKETKLNAQNISWVLTLMFNLGILIEDESKLDDAISDLKSLKFDDTQIENFKLLMHDLQFPGASLHSKIGRAVTAAIPTVSDVQVVCDLRAVFEETVVTGADEKDITKLRALAPVVILSLDISEESNETRTQVIQFSETGFARFQELISRAAQQLKAITDLGKKASSNLESHSL